MEEQWKTIQGWNGYEVSNFGNVRSWKNKGNYKEKISSNPKIMSKWISNGYECVTLVSNSKKKHFFIHSLVASEFLGKKPEKHVVCHKDDNKTNNCVDNLYYGTYSQNALDAIKNKRLKTGESHPTAKLSDKDVDTIRHLVISLGKTHSSVAEIFGVARTTVTGIVNNRRKY